MTAPRFTLDEAADRLIDLAVHDPRVRALWIEADAAVKLRRPYSALEVHAALDEPDFPGFVAELEGLLGDAFAVRVLARSDTQRHAKQLDLELSNPAMAGAPLGVRFIAEQSYLLAKRPRAYVVPLVDKTGHLPHVLDYSARRR